MSTPEPEIYLAILNITSWQGQCSDATHMYGHLILSEKREVNVDNVEEWNVKYLGSDRIELSREMTFEEAEALDKKDGGNTNQRHWKRGETSTIRFNTFAQVEQAGIKLWKELGLKCPFISLYEGEKYHSNAYGPDKTIILQYEEI